MKFEKHIPRPAVVELLYKNFSTVDIHDHFRQGSLNFEEGWKTHTWWHRNFASILGIIITDSFLAMSYENPEYNEKFHSFCGKLCLQLINNPYLEIDRGVDRGPIYVSKFLLENIFKKSFELYEKEKLSKILC